MIVPMTIEEYAERLGKSPRLIYGWIKAGTLPPDVQVWRTNRMWIIPKQKEKENLDEQPTVLVEQPLE